MKSNSIQGKIFGSFLALTLVLSFLISFFSYTFSFNMVEEKVSESFSLSLDYIEAHIAAELDKIYKLMDYVFTNETIKEAIISYDTAEASEAVNKNTAAIDVLQQYAVSQFYENINRISVIGYNGYKLQHLLNYVNYMDDGMSVYYDTWAQQAIDAKGQCVWGGLITRKLNPLQEDSVEIKEIVLFRAIKNLSYTDDIGFVYITLNSRFFLSHIEYFEENYPDFASKGNLLIMDNNGSIINSDDNTFSDEELSEILNSEDSTTTEGHQVPSQNCIAFVKTFDNWSLIGTVPLTLFTASNSYMFQMSIISFLLSIIVCALIWFFVANGIFRPIHDIAQTIKRIEGGESTLRIKVESKDEIGQLGENLNHMLERIKILNKENLEKELHMRDAMHRARQAQINPHFIYNTLNSIRWLAVMVKADSIKKCDRCLLVHRKI